MKHTVKQALALFIAVLLATLGSVSALSEGIEPPVPEAGVIELGGEPGAGASDPSTIPEDDSGNAPSGETSQGDPAPASADGASQGDPAPASADGTSQGDPAPASDPLDAEGDALQDDDDALELPPDEVDLQLGQGVSVVFDVSPAGAALVVRPENSEEAIAREYDGSFLLLPGEYTYSAGAEGYASVEAVPFTVTGDEQPLLLSIVLEAQGSLPEGAVERSETEGVEPEPVAFDQSMTVNGVVVTVKAEPGVFPANAALSVKRVPTYRQRQADAAIGEVRDDGANVAVSYTFDIKVIDPETRAELQPAEGQTVSVSFALAEVADENLETSVYHIDDSGAAQKLDVTQEDAVTATVETEGFSLYTVEFTYNKLAYTLPGDTSVLMSEILTDLGLIGAVEAVEVSDPGLFSASDATGEWVVTAHRAFNTTEWMKVTIGGVAYEITVTDDQNTGSANTETMTFTFDYRDDLSYIVYNNTLYKLNDNYFWDSGTATCGGLTVTITGSGIRTGLIDGTGVVVWTANYSFSHASKYITHVKLYY